MLHPPAGQIGNQHRHTAAGWCPSRCPWAAAGHSRASKQRRLPHQHTRHRPLLRAPRGPRSLAAVPVGAGGRGQDLAGLQNDADHPPAHQAPPAWRATRELRDKRGLAVGLGGGARGRRGLDGMCTAMKSPTGVEGAGGSGGLGRASRSTTPSRRLACGDLAGGPPPSGTKTGSPDPEGTANPDGKRAGGPDGTRNTSDAATTSSI